MALVTRCPECATLFKVVPDQLRISEGWVRCGHCNEVFDASVDLHQQAAEAFVAVPLGSPAASGGVPTAALAETPPGPPPTPSPSWSASRESEPAPLHLEFPDPPQLSQLASEPPRNHGGYDSAHINDVVDRTIAHMAADAGFEAPAASGDEADDLEALEAQFDRELLAIEEEAELQREADPPTPAAFSESALSVNAPVRAETDEIEDAHNDVSEQVHGAASAESVGKAGHADVIGEPDEAADQAEGSGSDAVEPSVPDMPSMGEDAVFVAPMVSTAAEREVDVLGASAVTAQADASARAPAAEPSVHDYTFLRGLQAQHSVWRKPGVRYGLMGLASVLLLGLALQWLVVQREVVAAHWPQSRAFLVSLCEPMGCTVSALRRIDAVAIDSSSFTALRRGAYRLNVVLKNRGPYPLAIPAIELALTDTQEQPVIRRVVQAHDLGVTADTIDANGELVAAVELAVPDGEIAARIAGYRLLAFYP